MITIDNINKEGLVYIIIALNDILQENDLIECEDGLKLNRTWLTPKTCYWLYKLLTIEKYRFLANDKILRKLKEATNAPETLK